jgi:RNA polymerase sigma-70 factor (ECF subfamily)
MHPKVDQADFVRLLTQSHQRLLGYLLSLLGNRHDAEDVLQRASMTMWRRLETFEPGTDFLAWASTVAFYEAKNFLRVAARSPLRFDDDLLALIAAERIEDLRQFDPRLEALEHCLKRLDATQRALVHAVYHEGAEIGALADRLGRAPQTMYNRLHLIRRALAECVEQRLAERPA